ncbi:Brp/Blh family beta-carotene 15,15'-dioxygenase [Psychroflexus salis]|uniref:Probable beta-carotene 15,15'-dioxygenase n=1 Tax=Psychroflexus salis TaxID=1526574 RepID=A0A917E8L1_9FLAO|nr:Brp/Blh family beta-carotene 15,15'-dioxygenase [Psychroflexus salis]GGE09935.1 hypothetical protein GCM10010831_09320 [Psychroflexus salis]
MCFAIAQLFTLKQASILALFLILSVGILHGANDILLIEKTKFLSKKNRLLSKIIYIMIVVLAIIMFYFIPFYALVFFILFSAYHFGEQHWAKIFSGVKYVNTQKLFMFLYGFCILNMLFWLQHEATNQVIRDIANFEITNLVFFSLTLISFLILLILSLFFYKKNRLQLKTLFKEFLILLLFALIFKFTPLLLGFAIYFTFWHSLPSLKDQIDFLYKSSYTLGFKKYFKDAGIYWFVSVIGLGIFVYFFYETKLFYSLLFTFIAAITFPHVIVMGKMFSYLKSKN